MRYKVGEILGKKNKKIKQNNNKMKNISNKKLLAKRKRIIFFVKCVASITIILGTILLIILSPLFDIEEIRVENNRKIDKINIIAMSRYKYWR